MHFENVVNNQIYFLFTKSEVGLPCSIVVNMFDWDTVISEFKLQSCYYINFQNNFLGKGMNLLIPLNMD